MTTISRRQFLQFIGLTGLGTQVGWLNTPTTLQGRALGRVAVLRQPYAEASTLTTLWPNSVHQVSLYRDKWLRVGKGYAPITAFQPMISPNPQALFTTFPIWAEVIAPTTTSRAYCAADAPLIGHLEHGKVVYALRSLSDDRGQDWLQISTGWIQADHLQPTPTHNQAGNITQLRLGQGIIEVIANQRRLLRVACRTPHTLPQRTTLVQKHPTANGAPWHLAFEDVVMLGVCHHNHFGATAPPTDDNCIELPLIVSRTLYPLIQNGCELVRL